MRSTRLLRHALLAVPALLVAALAQPVHASVPVSTVPVSPVPQTSWNLNGPVYASAIVGDTVFLGGRFTQATSATGETRARAGLAAFSLSTRALLPWSPGANGTVWALETDGTSLWAGGDFTKVNGRQAERLAKVSVRSGDLDRRFGVGVNSTVRSLELDHGSLFVGGLFTKVDRVCQHYLAKVNATSGAVQRGFRPELNGLVRSVVASPTGGDRLYIAGNFTKVNRVATSKVVLIGSGNGRLSSLKFETSSTGRALDISPDGRVLFGALGGSIDSAVAWSTATGQRLWRYEVVGDVHTVRYRNGTLWTGFADGALDDSTARLRALDAGTGIPDAAFKPAVNSAWGVRTIAVSDRSVVAAGNFTKVGGVAHKYVAFFGPAA